MGPMKGDLSLLIDTWLVIHLVCFFPTKVIRIIEIHLGQCVGKTAPGTELPRIICTGIGPLQLGVVLSMFFSSLMTRFQFICVAA